MSFRLTPPQMQWVDAGGNPLAGGMLYFYATGTNTPAPTYADAGLTTPTSNPIILDSSGSCPAPFLVPTQAYKVVLTDANGVTIYTVDPVSDPTSTGATVSDAFNITGFAGTARTLFLQTAGVNRWGISLDAQSETGSDTGSNLLFTSYHDDGTSNQIAFSINRATGQANFATTPTFAGAGVIQAGMVAAFAMVTPPTGWLLADGSAKSRNTYGALFSAIGTTFGSGDGSTTFNLPDLQGYFVRGYDATGTVDPSRTFGTTQQDQLQDHTHTYKDASTEVFNIQGGGTAAVNSGYTAGASTGTPNSGNHGSETRPKNVALLYCIKF